MPKTQNYLTDEEHVYLVCHRDESPAELARRLGRDYWTIRMALRRIRQDGWVCRLFWTTCNICGQPLAGRKKGQNRHDRCARAWVREYARQRRQGPHTPSTVYVVRYRLAHPDKTKEQRERDKARLRAEYQTLPPEERQSRHERWHEQDREDYSLTAMSADQRGEPWSQDEDEYILEHLAQPCREVALALNRTLWGVRTRRMRLLRQRQATVP